MIRAGSAQRSVHSRAWLSKSPSGARINTQRMGTAGSPVEYQMAVSEAISTVRGAPPYQLLTVIGVRAVFGSSSTAERFARRSRFRRGLPLCCGLRGGGGLFTAGARLRGGGEEGG